MKGCLRIITVFVGVFVLCVAVWLIPLSSSCNLETLSLSAADLPGEWDAYQSIQKSSVEDPYGNIQTNGAFDFSRTWFKETRNNSFAHHFVYCYRNPLQAQVWLLILHGATYHSGEAIQSGFEGAQTWNLRADEERLFCSNRQREPSASRCYAYLRYGHVVTIYAGADNPTSMDEFEAVVREIDARFVQTIR